MVQLHVLPPLPDSAIGSTLGSDPSNTGSNPVQASR